MTYTLYSKNGSCSMAVHAVMLELGLDVKLAPYQIDGKTNPDLARINPRGNVPVIEKGDFYMREGAAIMQWLCDEHHSSLLPRSGAQRAKALEWLLFATATMHPAYARFFGMLRPAEDSEAKTALLGKTIRYIQSLWDEVEQALNGKSYLCGSEPSIADILLTVIANWSSGLPERIHFGANCTALFLRISSRPAFQRALAEEGVKYNAVKAA